MRIAASIILLLTAGAAQAYADPVHAGQAMHPVVSTAGCSSSTVTRKIVDDLINNGITTDPGDIIEHNHCIGIIGDKANLGLEAAESTTTYRLVEDRGDGIGLFVSQIRFKDPDDHKLNDDIAFYAPMIAFRPDS